MGLGLMLHVFQSFSVLKEELELRDQKLIFVNFKESVMNTCVGVNKEMRRSFRDRIEQIPEGNTDTYL